MSIFQRHPLPWRVEGPSFDAYFVKDAKDSNVLLIGASDETQTQSLNDQGAVVTTTIRTPKRGAEHLAKMIVALPDFMGAMKAAHEELCHAGRGSEPVTEQLKTLLNRHA